MAKKTDKVTGARKAYVKQQVAAFVAENQGATPNDLAGIRTGARQKFNKLATTVKGRTQIVKAVGEPGGRKDLRLALKTAFTKNAVRATDPTGDPTATSGAGKVDLTGVRDATPYVPSRASSSMSGVTRDATPYIRTSGSTRTGGGTSTSLIAGAAGVAGAGAAILGLRAASAKIATAKALSVRNEALSALGRASADAVARAAESALRAPTPNFKTELTGTTYKAPDPLAAHRATFARANADAVARAAESAIKAPTPSFKTELTGTTYKAPDLLAGQRANPYGGRAARSAAARVAPWKEASRAPWTITGRSASEQIGLRGYGGGGGGVSGAQSALAELLD